ncbi:hypothetical protein C8R42DRAFT_642437 [Lentinula raphanica]|nr:hypothetical protein C8R42DRAFT_642437 [Lentinula raphanica]
MDRHGILTQKGEPWEQEYEQWINSTLEDTNKYLLLSAASGKNTLGPEKPRDTPQKLRLPRLPRDSQRFLKIFKATQWGITISKLWNWLRGNLVEALQVIKATLHWELIVQEPAQSIQVKEKFEYEQEEDSSNMVEIIPDVNDFNLEVDLDSDTENMD